MKKNNMNRIVPFVLAGLMTVSCNFLEPLPQAAFTDENIDQYPEVLRGFVDQIYNSYLPDSFYDNDKIGLSAISDEAVYSDENNNRRLFSEGNGKMTNSPFENKWNRNYIAINYANLFLKDGRGYATQYMLKAEADLALRRSLQGNAFGLRAYLYFDLLRMFAGEGTDGKMYGVPLRLEPTEYAKIDYSELKRASIDECCEQILRDCDSAYVYLKDANRDFPDDPSQLIIVTGSARYTTMDRVTIDALRAYTYLYWASPAWNPDLSQDSAEIKERYTKAAQYAAAVMKFKIEREGALTNGFKPLGKIDWTDPNSPEIIWCAKFTTGETTTWEKSMYPIGFGGTAMIVPSQALVDRFPAANGYPIGDARSEYNPLKPYENRDPRFYSTINYNGAKVIRNTDASDIMYTFDTSVGGADAPGLTRTSTTGYYIKKFLFSGWNPFDSVIEGAFRPLHHFRWTEMALTFAEAASRVTTPTDESTFGYSAKQALQWLRCRTTPYDIPGLGTNGDPYLEECAADGGDKFYELVKNEWHVETCFEGLEFYNTRRWATDVSEINVPIERVVISDGTYSRETVTTLNYPSLWIPLPYMDVRRCPNLLQNKGYESWK